MLNLRNYADVIEEIEPGQTIRIDHTDCDAGEDTRQRLYLTRTHADDTIVVGYCHNCQQGGRYTDGSYQQYRNEKHGVVKQERKIEDNVTEPDTLVYKLVDWPIDAKAWALSRGISQVDADRYSIAYDSDSDRIYLPKQNNRDLEGYQLRAIHPWQRPKYLTASTLDAKPWTYLESDRTEATEYVVLVEDLVSGIHIIRACEDDPEHGNCPGVYVLHGVKIDPTLMYKIARDYAWATVWLDNDNAHVENQAKLMARTILMYGLENVRRVDGYHDPKNYEPGTIRTILDEVWDG